MMNPGEYSVARKPTTCKTLDFSDRAENNELGGTTVRLYIYSMK